MVCRDIVSGYSLQDRLVTKREEALDPTLPFDEKAVLERSLNYLTRTLDVSVCCLVNSCSSISSVLHSSRNCGLSLWLMPRT